MKKKVSSKDNLNLFFSAFLIIAYIVCGYFFMNFAQTQSNSVKGIIIALIFVLFGAILFYATRVGDGKPVKRFSLVTLLLMDIPALYVVLATVIPVLPLHNALTANSNAIVFYMAAVALGYGIPYTFLSGFEMVEENEEAETEVAEIEDAPLEGGIEEEIQETETQEETQEETQNIEETEEVVVEGVDSQEVEKEVAEEETAAE